VGFNEQRGDRVEVVSMRFAEPEAPPPPGMLGIDLPQAMVARLVETGVLALVALLAILLVGRPLARRLAIALAPQPALAGAMAAPALNSAGQPMMAAALPDATPGQALARAEQDGGLEKIETHVRPSSIQKLAVIVQTQPDAAMTVLRGWMSEDNDL
jgi:flagellar M-ring protein FliF